MDAGLLKTAPELAANVAPMGEPAMLTPEECAYWRLWEPSARQNGTLTEATMPGFVLLCQTAKRAAEIWGQVTSEGFTYLKTTIDGAGQEHNDPKAHPLLTHWRGLVYRQEQLLARYGLASMGRPTEKAPVKKDDERDELRRLMAVR